MARISISRRFHPQPKINVSGNFAYHRQHQTSITGSHPFVAASYLEGNGTITISIPGNSEPRPAKVRLFFAENEKSGTPRNATISLQEKHVLTQFNIASEADLNETLVKEFSVTVKDQLTLNLKGSQNAPPRISGLELIFED